MLTLEQVQDRLKMVNIQAFAKFAGIHPNSLYRLRDASHGDKTSYALVERVSAAIIEFGGNK